MVNVLIISNEAESIYSACAKSGGPVFSEEGRPGEQYPEPGATSHKLYDLALLDLDLDDWQHKLLSLRERMPVIVFSKPDIQAAVEAMKLGASDYLAKPIHCGTLEEVISRHSRRLLNKKHGFDEIIGVSVPMQEVFGLIKRAAASESNVLITGESGTGKELISRAIHRWSPRSDREFMSINCSAIPDTLLESELFGFEKGAFTGANYTKKGLLEAAHGGTVLFDEIGDVSPMFQIKVLRVIQEGEIMRVGGTRPIKVDVRIIAATNRDLKSACLRGSFREDLYFRLNVINIHLPPLRDRMEDLPLLAKSFLQKHASKRKDMVVKGVSAEALKLLMSHQYPGNVRELENIIERAISFTNTPEILPTDLPAFLRESQNPSYTPAPKLNEAVANFEREVIQSALRESGGNISRAAASLGIYRQQLQRKLKSLDIAT